MPHCIAYGCNNNFGKESIAKGIRFHRLPLKNPVLMKKWLAALKLEKPHFTATSRICSQHFEDECFLPDLHADLLATGKSRRMLKEGAVPTIFSFAKRSKTRVSSLARSKDKARADVLSSLMPSSSSSERIKLNRIYIAYVKCSQTVSYFITSAHAVSVDSDQPDPHEAVVETPLPCKNLCNIGECRSPVPKMRLAM